MTLVDKHTITVTAGTTPLDLIDGTIVIDDTRAPWIDATLTVAGTDLGDDLDATQVRRVQIVAEQRFSDWAFTYDLSGEYAGLLTSDITTLYAGRVTSDLASLPFMSWNSSPIEATRLELSLLLQSVTELPDGTTRVQAASDEAALLELRHTAFVGFDNYGIDNTLRTALVSMLAGDLEFGEVANVTSLLPGPFDADVPVILLEDESPFPWLPWKTGQTLWEAAQPALQRANARLIGWGQPGIDLISADYTVDDSITIAAGVNLIDYQAGIDRTLETFGDAVIITYSEPNGIYQASSAVPAVGTWSKPIHVEIDGTCPINQFSEQPPQEPAEKLLARALKRAYTATATAVSSYAVRPRWQATLSVPDQPGLTATVQQITFNLATFQMSLILQEVEALP